MPLITLFKKPTLEEQLKSLSSQIEGLKRENRELNNKFLLQIFPDTPTKTKTKIHNFADGYVRVLGDDGEYYYLDNYGDTTPEDYHYLQQSPNSTHLQAAKEMGPDGDKSSGGAYQGVTSPEEFDRQWDQAVQAIKPKISKSHDSQIIGD